MKTSTSIGWVVLAVVVVAVPIRGEAQEWRDIENERPPVYQPLAPEPEPGDTDGDGAQDGSIGLEILGGMAGFAIPATIFGIAYSASGDTASLAVFGLMPFTVSGGIYLAGEGSGGHGSFGYTFLGQAIGGLASVPLVAALLFAAIETDEHCGDTYACSGRDTDAGAAWGIGIFTTGLLTIGGGVLGYELSDHGERRISVSAAPTRDGGTLSVTGTF